MIFSVWGYGGSDRRSQRLIVSITIRPSKKENMFHVRVFQKKEEEGLFIFYFLFFKMAAI